MRMRWLGLAVLLFTGLMAWGQGDGQADSQKEELTIRAGMAVQVEAWNRGDVAGFMETYEDSPETTFIGADIHKGFASILERYKKAYSSKEQMGTLNFTDLNVRMLPGSNGVAEYAVVTGRFHLVRSAKGEAKKDDGIFSLIWHKSAGGWKILLDHTS